MDITKIVPTQYNITLYALRAKVRAQKRYIKYLEKVIEDEVCEQVKESIGKKFFIEEWEVKHTIKPK